uniref:C2H2-type domain-containing protein n=1 Tax=Poecilia latipinna TaxID=48699 RepID=A0A3B3VFV9_9TELE
TEILLSFSFFVILNKLKTTLLRMTCCNICSKMCSNTAAYLRHMRKHCCMSNVIFKCGFSGCSRQFSKFSSFKCHIYRHKVIHRTAIGSETVLKCHIILKALPNLCKDTQEKLVSTLVTSGVESAEDLKYIQQEDIKDLLSVVQQRKLLETFNMFYSKWIPSPALPFFRPSSASTSSLSSIPPISPQPSIQTAISEGKRPRPDKRRQMIRILADEVQKYEANPTRSQCLTICQKITRQYPGSFADMTPCGKLIAGGYSSLLSQLKTRIENINRCGSFRKYRSSGPCGIAGVKRGPTDIYGCTRFQPELPPEETDDTVEEKRQRLQSTFNKYGINGDDRPEVTDLMETTYSLQRKHINELPAPSIADLQINWPYLFTQRGIFSHFELLTDVPLLRVLELSFEKYGNTVVESSPPQTNITSFHNLCICILLFYALVHATQDIEGRTVFEGVQPTFQTGLAAVFATFYIFNLQYQHEAAKTLEFIQRPSNKKRQAVNVQVSTLIKNLMDFEWHFIQVSSCSCFSLKYFCFHII